MIKARYIGDGAFWHGIPARDLSDAEYAALTDDQRALVDDGRLYAVAPTKPKPGKEDA